jgi:hypothetical protein
VQRPGFATVADDWSNACTAGISLRAEGCCCVREEDTALKFLLCLVGYAAYTFIPEEFPNKIIPRYFKFP